MEKHVLIKNIYKRLNMGLQLQAWIKKSQWSVNKLTLHWRKKSSDYSSQYRSRWQSSET